MLRTPTDQEVRGSNPFGRTQGFPARASVPTLLGVGGPREGSTPLTRGRRLLLGLLGFAVAGTVSAAAALSTGSSAAGATPTASAVPTQPAVRVLSVARDPEQDGFVSVVVLNQGPAVRLDRVWVEGPGYTTAEGGGIPGLAARGSGSLFVNVRPDCSAGVGVRRRPELLLDVSTADGAGRTLRLPLIGSAALPRELLGQCDAPLADGARVAVRLLPPDGGSDVRLQVTLAAGRGALWVDELRGDVSPLGGGGTFLVQPGAAEVVDLVVRVSSCDAPPAGAELQLRREPGLAPRVVSLAEVGGQAYRDAFAAAFRKVCG